MIRKETSILGRMMLCAGAIVLAACGPSHASRGAAFPGELRAAELRSGGSERDGRIEGGALDRAELVRAVLAKNPGVASVRHAWRAARAREAQEQAWPDPMLSYSFAPLSIASADVDYGQIIQLSQRVPWPGKLSSRGDSAVAEAEAARESYVVAKLDLALEASLAHIDLWFIDRSLEINETHQRLLRELEQSAQAQYAVGRASLQDPLQAKVEIGRLTQDKLVLETQRDVVVARLNTLLHRPPDRKLPAPPIRLSVSLSEPAASAKLQREALAVRAELGRAGARIRAAESSVEAAEREYYPDVTLMAQYNSMWAEVEHQFMVGLETPIPLQRGGRGGAVDEASARAAEARSELSRTLDEIRNEVEVARTRVVEALRIARLYEQQLVPLAGEQVQAARAGFQSGSNSFVAVIEGQRNLRSVELARQASLAELDRRWSMLDRALGRVPGLPRKGGER